MQPQGERSVLISFRLENLLGWGVVAVLCLIPLIIWYPLHPLHSIHGFSAAMLNLGRICGLIGIVMYALNLIFATRLRFLEYFFGGLNRVYIAHHLLGGLALIFLCFHPVFMALQYFQTSYKLAALQLVPNGLTPLSALFNIHAGLHAAVLQQWAITLGITAFLGMVGLLILTFFVKLPYALWLFLHKWLGVFFFIAGLHVLFIFSDSSRSSALKYYVLSIAALGIIAWVYKTLMGRILIRKYKYTVEDVSRAGGGVVHLLMKPNGLKMDFRSGQFVFIRFINSGVAGLGKEWHPFSLSSAPKDEKLRLSVKALGDYTNQLVKIKPGTIAEIEGAYGRFNHRHYKNKNQVWIAGGIGITPFLSMARDFDAQADSDYHVDLYYSVKTKSELVDWALLANEAKIRQNNFRLIPYIADQHGNKFLTAEMVAKTSGNIRTKDIYICGPPAMMKSLRSQFRAKGVPGKNIHSEEFAMS